MKKIAAMLLAACLVLSLFAGCGGNDTPETTTGAPEDTTAVQTPSTEVTEPPTTQTPTTGATEPETVFEPQTVYEENGIKVSVVNAETVSGNFIITLSVENGGTSAIQLNNVYDAVAVNGLMIESYLACPQIQPGEAGECTITLWKSALSDLGVKEVAQVTVYQAYYIGEVGGAKYLPAFTVQVPGMEDYAQSIEVSGDAVYDRDGVTVLCSGVRKTADRIQIELVMRNNSGRNIRVGTEEIRANDIIIDRDGKNYGLMSAVCDGTVATASIYIWLPVNEYLIEGGTPEDLEDITKLSFWLSILALEDYTTIAESDTISISLG